LSAVLSVPPAGWAQCRISHDDLGHFQTVVMENEWVRVSALPQVGGRIFEYTLKSSGNNQLYAEVEKLAEFKPGDEIPRGILYEISGYEDIIKETGEWHWPGDFQQEPYVLEILVDSPETATIRLSAAKGRVRIARTHSIRRGSSSLSHVLEVTNTSEEEIEMMLRHKAGLRPGGEARMGDTIVYPSQNGVVRKPFFPDNIWMDFLLTDGWIAASDPEVRETLLLTSPFESLSNGGVWFDKKYFYNLEFFGKKQMVPAGETVSLETEWHILSDVPAITFSAAGQFLGYFRGTSGEDNAFTLETGLVPMDELGPVSMDAFLYNGPNRIDGFVQQLEAPRFGSASSSVTQRLFSPVNEVHATFQIKGRPDVKLVVPLVDTRPPEPVVLTPLTDKPFRYTLQDPPAYQLWIESTAGVVAPGEVFVDSNPPRNVIEIDLLPNEYECFQLAIRPKQGDIGGIVPEFEDLKEVESGATLAADSFLFYAGATIMADEEVVYDPLIPGSPATAEQDRNAMLFVELYCDPMQLPGTYEGRIRLHAPGLDFEPIDIQVKVRPFRMPHARSIDTAFWIWKTWYVAGANTTDFWPNLARYRLSPGFLKNQFHAVETVEFLGEEGRAKSGTLEVGTESAKASYIEGLHDLNINRISPGYNIWGYADTHEWKHRLTRSVRAQSNWLDEHGFLDHTYYQIVDEPLASRFAQLKQVIKLYRQANPDYKIMCTVAINPDLYGYIDMWHVPWGALEPKVAEERRALGEKVWCYNALPNITGAGKMPRLIGWFCWKYKLDGYMHFAIDYPDSSTVHNPWLSNGSRWTILFYPVERTYDPDKHVWENFGEWDWSIPSIRLMQIRDGFEDYEYMKMLERWVLLAKRHGKNERNQALIEEAEAMLEIENDFIGNFISYTQQAEELMEARRRVGKMIERLRADVTGEPF
jgi:hypothetical protein